ncbi:MAG: Smr/MutS family protein [Gammaproteobacteria bacterium]|jgi:DNA-nicking Smr family endonuclease
MSDSESSDDDNDDDLFRQLMGGVKPLSQDKIDPDSAPKPRKTKRSDQQAPKPMAFTEREYLAPVAADAVLSFARSGVQQKIISKLKKGQFVVERKIDLHGSTIEQAGAKLQHALDMAHAHQERCLLVVHGRGKGSFDNKPAIKTHVNQWLRDSDNVIAFHSAPTQQGGTGAVFVLLRRQREK